MQVEPKISFACRKRNLIESSGASHPFICYECLHLAIPSMRGTGTNDEFFLVGQKSKGEEGH